MTKQKRDAARARCEAATEGHYDNDELSRLVDISATLVDFLAALDALDAADAEVERLKHIETERDLLLAMTERLYEHPEDYDGPCLCKLCQSYGD